MACTVWACVTGWPIVVLRNSNPPLKQPEQAEPEQHAQHDAPASRAAGPWPSDCASAVASVRTRTRHNSRASALWRQRRAATVGRSNGRARSQRRCGHARSRGCVLAAAVVAALRSARPFAVGRGVAVGREARDTSARATSRASPAARATRRPCPGTCSRPWSTMPTRSAISSAIDSRCVDMKIVWPAAALARSRSLTSRTLRGSSPTIGSSITSTLGSCSMAAAKASRCFMPCE